MKTLLANIYLVYFGLILGISFLATPVKFRASHLTLPVALEVGRETFFMFNKVEWIILVFVFVLAYLAKNNTFQWINLIFFILLALATFYLLPKLDQRTELVISGYQLSRSFLHQAYVCVELAKLGLCVLAVYYLQWRSV